MKSASFEVRCPPSLNEQKKWSVGRAKRFRDGLVLEMTQALNAAGCRPTALDRLQLATEPVKRIVKFMRFFGGRVHELDKDNLIGGCKPLLDELKLVTWRRREYGHMVEREGFGFIFDDAPEYCCAIYDQKRDPAKAGLLRVEVA